jgi:hypothetical protein
MRYPEGFRSIPVARSSGRVRVSPVSSGTVRRSGSQDGSRLTRGLIDRRGHGVEIV